MLLKFSVATKHDKQINTVYIPDFNNLIEIPFYEGTVPAGFPSPAENFKVEPLSLDRKFIRNPMFTFILQVDGDSMSGDCILDGDYIIVDKSIEPYNGCIAVCFFEGTQTVKRLEIKEKSIRLVPSNPAYQPIDVTDSDSFLVWGVVKHSFRSY